MSYNFLKDARSIDNSFLCAHDSLDAYSSDFNENGNVDGWDIYNNVYLYGCWNGVLFGHTIASGCYISRSDPFVPVAGEDYYYIKLMLKVTDNNPDPLHETLTTGKIMWTRSTDHVWNSVKQEKFNIIADNKWHAYNINMGPKQYWQGSIDNLRIYPFINGKRGDSFAIKYIKISSLTKHTCNNTNCSYYTNYSYPCQGTGSRGSCEAGTSSTLYSTTSGVNDEIYVNIDGYGYVPFNLGTNSNATGIEMARVIANNISDLNIGGYAYASCHYSDNDKLKIYSGSVGTYSSVSVSGSAAISLGFRDADDRDISTRVEGSEPATGFDYASSRLLTSREISRLLNGDKDESAYQHAPQQYSVEGGRRDFNQVGTADLISDISDSGDYYESLDNTGRTIIDFSHPIDNSGRLKAIYVCGVVDELSKIKILRPSYDGTLRVIYSIDMPLESDSYLYTTTPIDYRVDCDILVSRGDLIGIYNANLYVGKSITGLPDATFCQVIGDVSGIVDPGQPYSFGLSGFSIYARGDRRQNNTILDIDLGNRVNIENISIYGSESSEYFEYNIANCLDVSWTVDTFGLSHNHCGFNWSNGTPFYHTHLNIVSGEDALNDGIITPDNGRQGDTFSNGSNGMQTFGHHSYCYVDGDAEWLYQHDCTGKTEYCWPRVPGSSIWCNAPVSGFRRDPIAYYLTFPYDFEVFVHKSIIYFKERNNFRNMALSYYLGAANTFGNADDNHYQYVPSYNSIRLDGILYEPDDGSLINEYIFSNPMDSEIIYAKGDSDPINWENYRAASYARWNIIEHNFDPIKCAGFRIYTAAHNSTKIMEMELYSKMSTSASLVDNAYLTFSDYGDVWVSAGFEEDLTGKITAFLGGSPRYLQLELESASEFILNEIELEVGDQVKLEECDDMVLLSNSKSEVVNNAQSIVLENIYEKKFDLYVDLPKETFDTDDLVFWSKLHSQEDLDNPQIGPRCILHNKDDYFLLNDNYQCAINCPAYGLKNLIDGKNSYEMKDLDHWEFFNTLSSGISVDYYSKDVDYKDTIITFDPVSSKYWKLINSQDFINLDDIAVYIGDTKQDIDYVFTGSKNDITSQEHFTEHDNGVNIWGGLIKNDVTNEWVLANPDNWNAYSTSTGTADWELTGSHFYVLDFGEADPGGYIEGGPTIEYEFDPMTDFTIDLGFIIHRTHTSQMSKVQVYLYDESDNEILWLDMINVWASRLDHEYTDLYNEGVKVWGTVDLQYDMYHDNDHINIMRFKRSGSILWFKINDRVCYNSTFSSTSVSKIKLALIRNDEYPPPVKAAFYFGSFETMGFGFTSSQPVDKIRLRHATVLPTPFEIWISPNNADNYAPFADSNSYIWNEFDKAEGMVLSDGNLTVSQTVSSSWRAIRSVWAKSSGKWYWETSVTHRYSFIGIGTSDETLHYPGYTVEGYGYYGYYGRKYHDGSYTSYGDSFTTGDVIGTALDLDNGKIWWSKNGVWQDSGVPASGTSAAFTSISGTYYAMVAGYYSACVFETNFGKDEFIYAVPDGFSAVHVSSTVSEIEFEVLNENHYNYLAIDLEKRHDLEIIRNYGPYDNKLFLGTGVSQIDYSNSETSNPDDVDWDNSTYEDARWLRIYILSGDDQIRYLDKVGIYPNIETTYCIGGGYNCEWHLLGTILSDYVPSRNVAYGATTTGTNSYFLGLIPDNAVDGIYSEYQISACWGFQEEDGIDPYLELDFENVYLINKVVVYHGYDPDDTNFVNAGYTFSISPTITGSFTDVFSISGNSDSSRIHQFDPVYARRARLTITDYTGAPLYLWDEETGQAAAFIGSLLREIEVYTFTDTGYVDSETWPIVSMNLLDQFNITDHEVFNKDINDTDTDWDNDEEYFRYSDNVFADPQKVTFSEQGDYITQYQTSESTGNLRGSFEYTFDTDIYFDTGRYYIEYETYELTSEDEISVTFIGLETINHFAETQSSDWTQQTGEIEFTQAGFYTIKAKQWIDALENWGVRNIYIYRTAGLRKWISVKKDTATEYSWDDDSDKYGQDYLSLLKVYGDEAYRPTEYSWWWRSTISELTNNSFLTKVGRWSLEINYPTSSGVDSVDFLEGDDFGEDVYFTAKDRLFFHLYIDDVSKLDTSFGDITFGDMFGSPIAYYIWRIEDLDLRTGWNQVKLPFESPYTVIPAQTNYQEAYDFFDDDLDFADNGKPYSSFRIRYRGKGQSFNMYIDNLKIMRNKFEDTVEFGKGLCLTGYDYLEIPVSSINLERGTIEFWIKAYTDSYGRDKFENMYSRVFFSILNNNNDLISLGIKSGNWLEPVVGHARRDLNLFDIDFYNLPMDAYFDIDDVVHIALVWDNGGSFTDNGDTIRLYMNGIKMCSSKETWEVGDTKSAFIKLGGPTTQLAHNKDAYGSAVFENVKLYNYCKDSFNLNIEGVGKDVRYTPNDFLEISSDNVNFYGVGSENLPIIFEGVPSGDSRTIYVRSNKNENFKQSKKTANIIVDWLVTV